MASIYEFITREDLIDRWRRRGSRGWLQCPALSYFVHKCGIREKTCTLVRHFKEGVHYCIEVFHPPVENLGGRPSERIRMTPDTFKELCMLSETTKGKELRQYYIRMEKMMKAYLRERAVTATRRLDELQRSAMESAKLLEDKNRALEERDAELAHFRAKQARSQAVPPRP